ncbi:MAG: hypothetical protein C0467_12000 [Planctomycetaceae bacterium]|nr:hypothetical protein [Planctomycetaceae bacterium]
MNAGGCSLWRNELEEEKTSLEASKSSVQDILDKNAPVGSRWGTSPDTARLLDDKNRYDKRIREIDEELK